MTTIRRLLDDGAKTLAASSSTPRLDAELLLGRALGLSRAQVIAYGPEQVDDQGARSYEAFIERRRANEPVAYILGTKEFWGLDFLVTPDVLIPRPETEYLVEEGLKFAGTVEEPSILDLGTGSGCIIAAVVASLKRAGRRFRAVAADSSSAALEVASRNAVRLGLGSDIEFVLSDWFDGIPPGHFNLILSNPPYISEGDSDVSPELRFEPPGALYSGSDGRRDIDRIVEPLSYRLARPGLFLAELGSKLDLGDLRRFGHVEESGGVQFLRISEPGRGGEAGRP